MIPPMTDPKGRHWRQPPREDIRLDGIYARMSQETFEALADYSQSRPTALYAGKMWRQRNGGGWILRWVTDTNDPEAVDLHWAWIVLPTAGGCLRESVETHLL
jgi:hypothetical protein